MLLDMRRKSLQCTLYTRARCWWLLAYVIEAGNQVLLLLVCRFLRETRLLEPTITVESSGIRYICDSSV